MPAIINYKPETCEHCEGTGRSSGRCIACGGQGSVLVAQPARKCAYCGGTGRDAGTCPACEGSGWAHSIKQISS